MPATETTRSTLGTVPNGTSRSYKLRSCLKIDKKTSLAKMLVSNATSGKEALWLVIVPKDGCAAKFKTC